MPPMSFYFSLKHKQCPFNVTPSLPLFLQHFPGFVLFAVFLSLGLTAMPVDRSLLFSLAVLS